MALWSIESTLQSSQDQIAMNYGHDHTQLRDIKCNRQQTILSWIRPQT